MGTEHDGSDRELEALIDQIRRTGLDQANDIAEQYANRADVHHQQHRGSPADDGPSAANGHTAAEEGQAAISGIGGRPDRTQLARRAVDATMALLPDLFDLLRDGLDEQPQPTADGPADVVVLPDTGPGGSASATLWVTPRAGSASGSIRLFATDLHTHDGVTLAGRILDFEPESLTTGGDAEPEPVLVQVTVPVDTTPGRYHGLILASGLPAAAQRVLVVVR